MGGSRVSIQRWMFNILVVFTICGIWHGANYTFVLWGFAYGVIMILERSFNKIKKTSQNLNRNRLKKSLNIFKTFTIVTLLWTLFRATSLTQFKQLYEALFSNINQTWTLKISPLFWIALFL